MTTKTAGAQRIFISYSSVDWEQYVEPLAQTLTANGFSYWIDHARIKGGQNWLDEINQALEDCTCLVLCMSPEALQSEYVRIEYRYFINKRKPIVPLLCRSVDTLPAELEGRQYLRYGQHDALIARLKEILAAEAPSTRNITIPAKKDLITVSVDGNTVSGTVDPQYVNKNTQIVVYAKTDIWYLQPYTSDTKGIPVDDTQWRSITRNWDEIVVFLTRDGYNPPFQSYDLTCPPSDIVSDPDVIDYNSYP